MFKIFSKLVGALDCEGNWNNPVRGLNRGGRRTLPQWKGDLATGEGGLGCGRSGDWLLEWGLGCGGLHHGGGGTWLWVDLATREGI